jgi:hypothetical protein
MGLKAGAGTCFKPFYCGLSRVRKKNNAGQLGFWAMTSGGKNRVIFDNWF